MTYDSKLYTRLRRQQQTRKAALGPQESVYDRLLATDPGPLVDMKWSTLVWLASIPAEGKTA